MDDGRHASTDGFAGSIDTTLRRKPEALASKYGVEIFHIAPRHRSAQPPTDAYRRPRDYEGSSLIISITRREGD